MVLFSIRDLKAGSGNRPFASTTRETAQREISMGLTGPDNPMAVHATDFQLYEIGRFDIYTMKNIPTDPAELVCEISELLPKETTDGEN